MTAGLAVALMEAVTKMDDIGGAVRTELQKEMKKLQEPAPTTEGGMLTQEPAVTKAMLEDWAAFIRIERCQDPDLMKLQVAPPRWPALDLIKKALVASGTARLMQGIAPAGYMEDELANWLRALE